MALNVAAAAAGGLNSELLNAFQPAGPVAARGESPRLVVARNDLSVPTINMFIDGESPDMRYAASIIDACADLTTYALRCTYGSSYLASIACGADAPIITLTAGPSTYDVSTTASALGASAFLKENCDLQGTTQAVCTATVGYSDPATSSTESATITMSGSSYYRYDVAITGGAEKTANPTGECKAPGTSPDTSPATSPGTSGASTKAVAMWGLVGAVGVASLLGF